MAAILATVHMLALLRNTGEIKEIPTITATRTPYNTITNVLSVRR
jgi:hypothetical protein